MNKHSVLSVLAPILILVVSLNSPGLAQASETRWTGAVSDDWFNAANWSDGVPDANTDVLIDLDSPRGPILSGSPAQVRNVRMAGRDLRVAGGGRLEAESIFVEFGGGGGDIRVDGSGSQLHVAGDVTFAGDAAFPEAGGADIRVVSAAEGGHLRIDGTLQLGDPIFPGNIPPRRVVNVDIRSEDSLIELGRLEAAILASSLFNWQEGTVRIFGDFTVGRRDGSEPLELQRQFNLNLGGRFGAIGPAPVVELLGDNPTIRLLNPMALNQIQLVAEQAEYRMESLDGTPYSIVGGFNVIDRGPGHTVSNGHHQVGSWRIEDGSAEFNGSVDGPVELGFGLRLNGTAEFTRLHSEGTVRVGNPGQTGTMRITEEFVQTISGIIQVRVAEQGHDQLLSTGGMNIQGGTIEITVEENAQPGSYTVVSTSIPFQNFGAAVEVDNHSSLLAQTFVSANQVRIELVARGELDLSTELMDFGSVAVGATAEQTLTLGNTGQAALLLSVQQPEPAEYSIAGGSCPVGFGFQILSGNTCTLTLRFQPTAGGETPGALALLLPDEGISRTVELRGRGDAGPNIFSDRFEAIP
ncbi:MAG: choice-of-anchor D domain-containing protein [Wenzhouxiangella sp.]